MIGIDANAYMMQQLINKATTTLNTGYILLTNKLVLMTSYEHHRERCHFPTSVLVIQFQGVSLFYSIDLIFIRNRALLSI